MIPNPVKLEFIPQRASPATRRVFRCPLARLLWLTWRPRHITNQHFNDELWTAVAWMREEYPRRPDELARLVHEAFRTHTGWLCSDDTRRWAANAFKFFSPYAGEREELRYLVLPTGRLGRALP